MPTQRRKPVDPDPRGAELSEIQPVVNCAVLHLDGPCPGYPHPETAPSITVPPDSTEEPPQEKDLLAIILTCKQVSVTELTETGRGMRLYLGKPSMGTFENMLRRSKGRGVVIEPDPRQDGVAVRWSK